MTKFIVGDRQTGRTERLLKWMLQGYAIDEYPGWSRVVVCPTFRQVVWVQRRLRKHITDVPANTQRCPDAVWAKAVWVASTVSDRLRGSSHELEIGIDNFDALVSQLMGFAPSVIVMEGANLGEGDG